MQIGLLQKIFRRYDLAIAFTTNERSNLYAFFAGRTSIGAREKVFAKNWWHRLLLDGGYLIDPQRHILENNLSALSTLGISIDRIVLSATYAGASGQKVQQMLKDFGMDRFIIFHPSGRYRCKSYPEQQRNSLLRLLDSLNIPIIVTGGHSDIDRQVAATLPELKNVRSFIGRLSLEECAALTDLRWLMSGSTPSTLILPQPSTNRFLSCSARRFRKSGRPGQTICRQRGAGMHRCRFMETSLFFNPAWRVFPADTPNAERRTGHRRAWRPSIPAMFSIRSNNGF